MSKKTSKKPNKIKQKPLAQTSQTPVENIEPEQSANVTLPKAIEIARQHHQQNNFQLAIHLYQQILQAAPNNPTVLHLMGIVHAQIGQYEPAIKWVQNAIEIEPKETHFHASLGNIFWYQDNLNEAKRCYQNALTLDENNPIASHGMGNIQARQNKFDEAIYYYHLALEANPNYAEAYNGLGNALKHKSDIKAATENYQRAVDINPQFSEAHHNLASVFEVQGEFEQAIIHYEQAIAFNPNDFESCNNLGVLLENKGQITAAIGYYQKILAIVPNHAYALNNLGKALLNKGMVQAAITEFEKTLEVAPIYINAFSNLLMTLNYSEIHDAAAVYAAHQQFDERYVQPLADKIIPHMKDLESERPLRIAYLSNDFRRHATQPFIESILAHHDHQQFKIYCYHNFQGEDEVTQRIKQYADVWTPCAHISDEDLARKIRFDQIDILVDLAGHSAHNRVLVLVLRPAPIQITYLGYPNTTGMTTVDYRITDNYTDPEGVAEQYNAEKLIRMPHSWFCYHPLENTPALNSLPALEKCYVTFGVLHRYDKINDSMLKTWASILKQVKRSKLLVQNLALQDAQLREEFEKRCKQAGIARKRLIIQDFVSSNDYLNVYHQIDICLDTFPYNGGRMTCDALWMGVPTVTLTGEKNVSRMGFSILSTVDLANLVADTPETYVDVCATLANDLAQLQTLRQGLRDKMLNSPLTDGINFTKQLETHYHQIWQNR